MRKVAPSTIDELSAYSEIIDVRSPSEYAEDHLPGAINLPVLDDEQRAIVGTQYAHDCFEGRWRGAAFVSANISKHLEQYFAGKPKSYSPLVYCWRGGQRSQSLATVMGAVGWKVTLLEGGYKAFRNMVRKRTELLCGPLEFKVLTGLTGAGKSRLLRVMIQQGQQVLDLEQLAAHRGSLLGDEPTHPQPAQKAFDTAIWQALETFQPDRPVWVESESRRVGKLFCPDPVWAKMTASRVTEMVTPRELRAKLLLEDYFHFPQNPQSLVDKLRILTYQHGHALIATWEELIAAGKWLEFTESMLEHHYDPAYRKAGKYAAPQHSIQLPNASPEAFAHLAKVLEDT